MQDRVPTKPNRYAVYDDNHNFLRYEYHERADEPTQVGDALNKANLLPDTVATALGLTGNPQVKDALNKLFDIANSKAQIVAGRYAPTNTFGESSPNSLTFPFVPGFVWILGEESDGSFYANGISSNASPVVPMLFLSTTYSANKTPLRNGYSKKSADGKTLYWYSTTDADNQFNSTRYTYYYYIAIGQEAGL